MKKLILIVIAACVITTIGVVFIAWYAGYMMKSESVYTIRNDPEIVLSIQKAAFSEEYGCLSYMAGTLCHGQDTFEIVKFNIDIKHPSWDALQKLILEPNDTTLPIRNPTNTILASLPQIIASLASDKELLIREFPLNQMKIYVTTNIDTEEYFLYIEGELISADRLESSIQVQ